MIWDRKKSKEKDINDKPFKKAPPPPQVPKQREGASNNINSKAANQSAAPVFGSGQAQRSATSANEKVPPQKGVVNPNPQITQKNQPQNIKNKIQSPNAGQGGNVPLSQKKEATNKNIKQPQPPKRDAVNTQTHTQKREAVNTNQPKIPHERKTELNKQKPQTPPPQKRKLTPEQEAERKRRLEEKRKQEELQRKLLEQEKKRRREIAIIKLKAFAARAVMTLFIYSILMVSVTVFIFSKETKAKVPEPFTVIIETGTLESTRKSYVSSNRVFFGKDDTLYLCISDLSEFLGLSVIGNIKGSMRFIIKDNVDSYIVVNRGSTEAMVNGVPIRLIEPAVYLGGKVYLPLDFFLCYTDGVDITYDKNLKKLKIIRTKDEENSNEYKNEYKSFSFVLKGAEPLDKVTVPAD